MMYPFMTLDDNAEIVHSEMKEDGRVKVYIEKPDARDCFHHATCWLPEYRWEDVSGFSDSEIARYDDVIKSTAHLIIRFSQEGGLENAAGFQVGSYWVYFWTNENKPLEPIHVHFSQGVPHANAPKIWITARGKCILASRQTEIPDRVMRNIMEVVEARSDEVIAKWTEYYGEATFYC